MLKTLFGTRKRRIFSLFLALILLVGVYLGVGIVRSLSLETSTLRLTVRSRTGASGSLRIAQLSDLHLAVFGPDNQALVDLVASKAPDLIVTTGDMIDVRADSYAPTLRLYERLLQIAPVAFSLGNHERDREDLLPMLVALEDMGVLILHNTAASIRVNDVDVRIAGLYTAEMLYLLEGEPVDILLCHFPEKLATYAAYDVPLTFSGHTHGGQFRLPLVNVALYAPGQGWFPAYTKGVYRQDNSHMIVSRGLGNSSFPFRVFNPPEVVIADITFANQVIRVD